MTSIIAECFLNAVVRPGDAPFALVSLSLLCVRVSLFIPGMWRDMPCQGSRGQKQTSKRYWRRSVGEPTEAVAFKLWSLTLLLSFHISSISGAPFRGFYIGGGKMVA